MNISIEESWKAALADEFAKPYFKSLIDFVKAEYATNTVYPPGKLIFNAFNKCPFDKVEVVLLGQDPYHGLGQANGLAFSVNDGITQPPSLRNIFKEIEQDLGIPRPLSGNLERWAEQGVLLLNATLTVRAGQPGSHQNKGKSSPRPKVDPDLMRVQNQLSTHFGTKIQIRSAEDGKGEIKIPFVSVEDLNRILEMLNF